MTWRILDFSVSSQRLVTIPVLTDIEQQVQPFHLTTPDNETLYGWHVLPLHLCQSEASLLSSNVPSGPVPVAELPGTPAYKLLTGNPKAKVIVNCE